jgi:hypothetical protein
MATRSGARRADYLPVLSCSPVYAAVLRGDAETSGEGLRTGRTEQLGRVGLVEVLLGDQPALAPEETFYQRILADDPDEASHLAEEFLKENSLSAYYDQIAIRGLALAQGGRQPGDTRSCSPGEDKTSSRRRHRQPFRP